MILITVSKRKAILSTTVKGSPYIKEVSAMYKEAFSVDAVLQNLEQAMSLLKTSDTYIRVILEGDDYVANLAKGAAYIRASSLNDFYTKAGKEVYKRELWKKAFKNPVALLALQNGKITFSYKQVVSTNPNYAGD